MVVLLVEGSQVTLKSARQGRAVPSTPARVAGFDMRGSGLVDAASGFKGGEGASVGAFCSKPLGAFWVIPARIAASSRPSTSSHATAHSTVAPALHTSFAAARRGRGVGDG